jgi:hypothetical protein
MPRDSSGTFTPAAAVNPVTSGTAITDEWANTTVNDIASGLTDSLDRQGRGGMIGTFKVTDGTVSAPGLSFTNETSSGVYRPSAGSVRLAVLGAEVVKAEASGVTVTGALTTTGNTILGDASTDTLNVGNGGIVKDASGKVGIGGTPLYKFDVTTTGENLIASLRTGSGYSTLLELAGAGNGVTTNSLSVSQASDNVAAVVNRANAALYFGTNSTERMRIDASGNVGIGGTPTTKFEMFGTLGNVQMPSAGSSINFTRADANYIDAGTASGFLIFRTSGANERMRIAANGAVTIGGSLTVGSNVVGSNSVGQRTLSTNQPSGGASGDIWYVY